MILLLRRQYFLIVAFLFIKPSITVNLSDCFVRSLSLLRNIHSEFLRKNFYLSLPLFLFLSWLRVLYILCMHFSRCWYEFLKRNNFAFWFEKMFFARFLERHCIGFIIVILTRSFVLFFLSIHLMHSRWVQCVYPEIARRERRCKWKLLVITYLIHLTGALIKQSNLTPALPYHYAMFWKTLLLFIIFEEKWVNNCWWKVMTIALQLLNFIYVSYEMSMKRAEWIYHWGKLGDNISEYQKLFWIS